MRRRSFIKNSVIGSGILILPVSFVNWDEEFLKCKEDIHYFIEKYCKVELNRSDVRLLNYYNYTDDKVLTVCSDQKNYSTTEIICCLAFHRAIFFDERVLVVRNSKDREAYNNMVDKVYSGLPKSLKRVSGHLSTPIGSEDISLTTLEGLSRMCLYNRKYKDFERWYDTILIGNEGLDEFLESDMQDEDMPYCLSSVDFYLQYKSPKVLTFTKSHEWLNYKGTYLI